MIEINQPRSGITTGKITPKVDSPRSVKKFAKDNISETQSVMTTSTLKPFDQLDNKISSVPTEIFDFKYTPYELVRLFKDFTKKKLNENEISRFFNELINWYSDLLCQAHSSLVEIKENNDLKLALNARYKAYLKHSQKLEDENKKLLKEIEKYSSVKDEIEKLKQAKYEEEKKSQELKSETTKFKSTLAENQYLINTYKQKWVTVEAEYMRFKQLFRKELKNIRFEYLECKRDKDNMRDLLLEFKHFCESNGIFEKID